MKQNQAALQPVALSAHSTRWPEFPSFLTSGLWVANFFHPRLRQKIRCKYCFAKNKKHDMSCNLCTLGSSVCNELSDTPTRSNQTTEGMWDGSAESWMHPRWSLAAAGGGFYTLGNIKVGNYQTVWSDEMWWQNDMKLELKCLGGCHCFGFNLSLNYSIHAGWRGSIMLLILIEINYLI